MWQGPVTLLKPICHAKGELMREKMKWVVLSTVIMLAAGCAGLTMQEKEVTPSSDPAIATQEKNIKRLNDSIVSIDGHIAQLKSAPTSPDSVIQSIRKNQLAGMKIRKELLTLLLDHCKFSLSLLEKQNSSQDPSLQKQIMEEWEKHEQKLYSKLNELDQKEDALERKRVEMEMQLIENSLQK